MAHSPDKGRLRYPVHFVCAEDRIWPELQGDAFVLVNPERLAEICVDSQDCWVLRTAYELRKLGETVSISARTRPDAINVGDIYNVGQRTRAGDEFIVVPRADGHDPQLANFTLLQNEASQSGRPSASVWHWLQPGIKPRDPGRGENISVVAFKGAFRNLDAAFQADAFKQALAAEGVTLRVDNDLGPAWGDYSDVDLILAVRNLTHYDAQRKPASKLVNAWWADVPALLGPEPAFAEIGRASVDYVDVRSPEGVIATVRQFRDNPGSYTRMVEAGRASRAQFTDTTIAERWIDLFNGPIGQHFYAWKRKGPVARFLAVVGMRLREPGSKRVHKHFIFNGERLLSQGDA